MRIRLLIERNELPSVSILWSFTPTQLSSTIAQFLEQVNVRFPLEGNTWGLEDYTVTLTGYEAQHYTKVGEVFKEDDEVVIKPLLFAEARARTISGRAQITADGRRLVDGVPFGKPLLKRMNRPEVDIPPARKRARIEAEEEEDHGAMVRFEEIEEEDDDDDEVDGDFEDTEDDEAEDDVELEHSEDDGNAEVEEADWYHATEWRVPIRSIYSNQCCLKKKYLILIWDDDKQHFSLTCGEDPVRVPGSDKVFTIGKKDVAVSCSTVDWTTNRADYRAILRASSDQFKIIEFKDEVALSYCFVRLTEATRNTMKSVSISAEDMQSVFVKQRKLLLAARAELRDDDEEEDSDDFDSSSDSSESGEDDTERTVNVSSDDSSDSSDSDSSSGSSSSSSDKDGKAEEGEEDSDTGSSSSSSRSNTSWNGLEPSDAVTPAAPPEPPSEPSPPLPHKGAARTKERNIRRREAARLKHLKEAGELPSATTLQQMQEWIRTGELPPVSEANAGSSRNKANQDYKDKEAVALELERKRQQLISDISGGGIDVSSGSNAAFVPTNMHPPQVKRSKKKSKSFTPTIDDDGPEEIPIATEPVVAYPILPTPTDATDDSSAAASQAGTPAEGPKRVSAAHRLIYGSLGLRAPKTQADKNALQKKLADRSKKVAADVPVVEQEVEDEDPEAWREKVVISAVECLDEGVELSEPPFPFQQKWDPQYWSKNVKKRDASRGGEGGQKRNKKRKKNGGGEIVEVYDKYNQDGGGDALDYDDPVDEDEETWDDGEDWQDGALLGADEEEEEDDGFPALPEDLTSLVSLLEADAKVGDFVVFTEMACSDATGWQPQMVTTVGCLDAHHADAWDVRFSKRGAAKEYDDEGNRVYKKFEMEGYDDEEEGDGDVRAMSWAEMMDVKLLLRPGVVEVQAEGVVDGGVASEGATAVAEQIQSQIKGEMEASSVD